MAFISIIQTIEHSGRYRFGLFSVHSSKSLNFMGIKFVLARFVVGSHLDPNEQLVAGVKKGRNFLASDEQRPLY